MNYGMDLTQWQCFTDLNVRYSTKKIVNNSCTVPSEVLRAQGVFYVGVMGVA